MPSNVVPATTQVPTVGHDTDKSLLTIDANEEVPDGTGRFAPVHVPPDNESAKPRTVPPIW